MNSREMANDLARSAFGDPSSAKVLLKLDVITDRLDSILARLDRMSRPETKLAPPPTFGRWPPRRDPGIGDHVNIKTPEGWTLGIVYGVAVDLARSGLNVILPGVRGPGALHFVEWHEWDWPSSRPGDQS